MKTIDAFDAQFPTEIACRQFLADMRWPDGVRCPRCNSKDKIYSLKARPFHWICKNKDCGKRNGYRFSVITHTIFQDTKIPLKLWFKVGYLMLVSKKGISALQVHRVIFGENSGSDYHTSWYMCHRWRAAMKDTDFEKLMGEVEVDETYIGGKDINRHWDKKSHAKGGVGKMSVIGAIARKGNIICKMIDEADKHTLQNFVEKTVSGKVSLIATDESPGYANLEKLFPKEQQHGFPHYMVTHSKKEYVRGNVHTNTIEGFWSLLKRGIVGTFHKVSKDYLPLYLAEFQFRYNNRKNPDAFKNLLTTCSQR